MLKQLWLNNVVQFTVEGSSSQGIGKESGFWEGYKHSSAVCGGIGVALFILVAIIQVENDPRHREFKLRRRDFNCWSSVKFCANYRYRTQIRHEISVQWVILRRVSVNYAFLVAVTWRLRLSNLCNVNLKYRFEAIWWMAPMGRRIWRHHR